MWSVVLSCGLLSLFDYVSATVSYTSNANRVLNGMLVQLDPHTDSETMRMHMVQVEAMANNYAKPTMYKVGNFTAYYMHGMSETDMEHIASLPEVMEMDDIMGHGVFRDTCTTLTSSVQTTRGETLLWNLERVTKQSRAFDGQYETPLSDSGDTNVDLYVIDTGIDITHTNFDGRASFGEDFTGERDVLNGHGTSVAGYAMSRTFGVAKQGNAISVKALAGEQGIGNSRITMDALQYVVDQVNRRGDNRRTVVNMSLGGGRSTVFNNFVNAIVSQLNTVVVVAAGNEDQDACNVSPASAELAITVGASTITDSRASFSNFGSCVDIFAPGQSIRSVTLNNRDQSGSGTSFSSPMVAGMVVNLLSSFPGLTPAEVKERLIESSTKGALSGVQGSPNRLAYQDCEALLVVSEEPTTAPLMSPNPISTPTATPTRIPSPTATARPTPVSTYAITPTPIPTSTPEVAPTRTSSPSVTHTSTPDFTRAPAVTPTRTATPITTPTRTLTPTRTPTPTNPPTATPTATIKQTPTPAPTPTRTPATDGHHGGIDKAMKYWLDCSRIRPEQCTKRHKQHCPDRLCCRYTNKCSGYTDEYGLEVTKKCLASTCCD